MKWKKIVKESARENENYGYTDKAVNAEYLSDILNSITRDFKSSGRKHPKLKHDMTTIKEAFNKFAELCGLSIAEDYSMIDLGGIDEAIQDLAEYYGDGAVEAGEEKDEGVLWALVELCNRLEPVPASTKSKVKGMMESEVVSEGDDEPMVATIEIPKRRLDLLNDWLENGCDYEEAGVDPNSHVFSTTAKFPDGIEADLNVCSEEEGSDGFWSEVCLYNDKGQEVALGEPSYGALGGEEEFEVNGNVYVVKIVAI